MTGALGRLDDDVLVEYLAFVLDLYDRFPREGVKVMELFAPRSRKPMRPILHAAARQVERKTGFLAEFGVHQGHSIRELSAAFPGRTIHGFDSFEGFPDDGRGDWSQDFAVPNLPDVPEAVKLHRGFFSETLQPFTDGMDAAMHADLLHIDCDIYSSAAEVFAVLSDRIVPGTVLIFDELVNYDEFLGNEMLALYEWTSRAGKGVTWLASKGKLRPLREYSKRVEGGFVGYRRRGWYQNVAMLVTDDPARDERLSSFQASAAELLEAFRSGSSPLDW